MCLYFLSIETEEHGVIKIGVTILNFKKRTWELNGSGKKDFFSAISNVHSS